VENHAVEPVGSNFFISSVCALVILPFFLIYLQLPKREVLVVAVADAEFRHILEWYLFYTSTIFDGIEVAGRLVRPVVSCEHGVVVVVLLLIVTLNSLI
jgi:hypothetical protein